MTRSHNLTRLAGLTLALSAAVLSTACIQRGSLRMAQPKVYDSETTRNAMAQSRRNLAGQLRPGVTHGGLQETFQAAQTVALSLSAGAQSEDVTGDAAAPDSAFSTAPAAPATSVPASSTFTRTIPEQISDYVHRENAVTNVDLLYAGDSGFGPNTRIYLVTLDIGLFPSRQSYWAYPFLCIGSGFSSTYNFTRDWFAQLKLDLPVLDTEVPDKPLIYFYDVEPRFSSIASVDALSDTSMLQLTAAYATPQGAVQGDFYRRMDEVLHQLRRYPMQMGLIENSKAATLTYGPRRQIVERSGWRYLNPFLGRYKIVPKLEPGQRNAHVLIMIPDVTKLEAALMAPDSESGRGTAKFGFDLPVDYFLDRGAPDRESGAERSDDESIPGMLKRHDGGSASRTFISSGPVEIVLPENLVAESDEEKKLTHTIMQPSVAPELDQYGRQSIRNYEDDYRDAIESLRGKRPVSKGHLVLPIRLTSSYLRLDLPMEKETLPIEGNRRAGGEPSSVAFRWLHLPLNPPADPNLKDTSVSILSDTPTSNKDTAALLLKVSGADFLATPPASVTLTEHGGFPAPAVRSTTVLDSEHVLVTIARPKDPGSGSYYSLTARVDTRNKIHRQSPRASYPYKALWSAATPDAVYSVQPGFGTIGERVTVRIGADVANPAVPNIAQSVAFLTMAGRLIPLTGNQEVVINESARTITFPAPEPSAALEGSPTVQVLCHFNGTNTNGEPLPPGSAGTFTYLDLRRD